MPSIHIQCRFSSRSGALGATFLGLLLATSTTWAQAPASGPDTKVIDGKVYTYVEHMPQLPGGGGEPAIVRAIRQRLVLPAAAGKGSAQDVVHVAFSVSTTGAVREARVVKGLNPELDAAVLAAVNQLPSFTPGSQNGRLVVVSYTVPVPAKPLR